MSKSTSTGAGNFFNAEFFKSMTPANSMFSFDLSSIVEAQRKNMEAVTEAQKVFVEGVQAMAQRQAKLMTQMVEDNSSVVKQIMTDGTPEEKVARQADLARDAYERSMSNLSEMAELVSKSNREAGEIISKRVTASLTEFKSTIEKTSEKEAA